MSKVFKAIGNAISGVVKAVVGVVKAVVGVVGSVLNFLTQPFMGPMDMPNAGQEAQRQDGVLIQRNGSNVNVPVIYGMRKVGGIVTYAETGSTNNQYLWVAYVFSEGLVEGLRELYIDDYQIDNATITNLMAGEGNVVQVGEGKYKDRVQLQFFPGVYYSDPSVSSVVPDRTLMKDAPSWKPSMYYNGLAVLFARFYWKKIETQADSDSNPFSGGIPEVQAVMLGRKVSSLVVADPSTTSYEGAGYAERYSTNPAEILLDYLRNPRYGKGLVNADIDWTTWKKAAVKCNQEVTYTGDIKGPILTCNYVLDTAQTLLQNTKLLLQGFRAYMPYVQGKYKLKIEDAGDPDDILSGVATIVATFDQDNIQGDVQFTGIDKGSKYSSVAVTYVDPDNKYSTQQVIYPETESERQTYVVLDGGRENKLEATFGTITNYAIAKDMARMLFNKSRRQESCTLTVSSQALELEPGDSIRIQSNILDFGTDPWRIVSFKLNDDQTVQLSCVRNPDDIYPHTRVGEEDLVLPVFVPKGATIYYPSSLNSVPIGLVPPTYVPGYNQSNPNTSAGGGVGGNGGTVNTTPITTPPVEKPLLLTDTISVTYVKYSVVSGNQLTANIEFLQPDNAMYDSVDIWYKASADNGYRKVRITDKPGAGRKITYAIPEIINQKTYECIARINYSTGETSQVVSKFPLLASAGVSEYVSDSIEVIQPGWTLPPYTVVQSRSNNIGIVYALAATSGSNRILNFQVQEKCLDTLNSEQPNPDIVGVYVYWKASSATYWEQKAFFFPPTYRSADFGTFTFDGNIGTTSTANTSYDFILRYFYKDGKQSTRQRRYMSVNVTSNPSHGFGVLVAPTCIQEDAGAFKFSTTLDNPAAVVDPLDLNVGIRYIFSRSFDFGLGQTPTVEIGVIPTEVTNQDSFQGLRLYYRPYDPLGQVSGWRSVDNLNTVADGDGNLHVAASLDFTYVYDFVLVPLVNTGSATKQETKNAWAFTGKPYNYGSGEDIIKTDVPTDTATATQWGTFLNYKSIWAPKYVNTKEALNAIQAVKTEAIPTVQVINWDYKNYNSNGPWDSATGSSNRLNAGYYLKVYVGHIANFQDIRIYRRQRVPLQQQSGYKYWGTGRWEQLTYSTVSSGYMEINLRPPSAFFELTTTGTLDSRFNVGSFGAPITSSTRFDEFFIVVRTTTNTESAGGVLLKGRDWATASKTVTSLLDNVINATIPPAYLKASFNDNYDAGYYRRLSEAVNSRTNANLTARFVQIESYQIGSSRLVSSSAGITVNTAFSPTTQ
jgi:hypothetical protein